MKNFLKYILPSAFISLCSCSNQASSVAVIGGADGPTAIYVATKPSISIILAFITCIALILILIRYILKKRK